MSDLQAIGDVLERVLFCKEDKELLKRYQDELQASQSLNELSTATGIEDLEVLGACIEHGMPRFLIMTIKFVPLILVAWSDQKLEVAEQESILEEILLHGLEANSNIMKLVERSLSRTPHVDLKVAYLDFLGSYLKCLSAPEMDALKSEIIGSSQQVALASGGFWGICSVSKEEDFMLLDIRALF